MIKGWCKRNYHADGKRKFGNLIDGLCIECQPKKRETKVILSQPTKPEIPLKVNQVNEIIKAINESPDVSTTRVLMRKGFNEIDELGIGWQILGYTNDDEYLASKFQCQTSHLRQQRTCGRLEKIMGIEIGTYSFNDLYPLFQFRIVMQGRIGKGEQKPKFSSQAIELVKETWEIAKKLAKDKLPRGEDIILAVKQMAKAGKAKSPRIRRKPKWENRYKALLKKYSQLEKENQYLRKELSRFSQETNRKPAQTVEEYQSMMNQLYQEQTRQQYQQSNHEY